MLNIDGQMFKYIQNVAGSALRIAELRVHFVPVCKHIKIKILDLCSLKIKKIVIRKIHKKLS